MEEGRSGMDSCTIENGARILNYGIRKGEKTGNGRQGGRGLGFDKLGRGLENGRRRSSLQHSDHI